MIQVLPSTDFRGRQCQRARPFYLLYRKGESDCYELVIHAPDLGTAFNIGRALCAGQNWGLVAVKDRRIA